MKIDIIDGMPIRILGAGTLEGCSVSFGVSTEKAGEIMGILDSNGWGDMIAEWDERVSYYIPDALFEYGTADKIVEYIDQNIDQNYFEI